MSVPRYFYVRRSVDRHDRTSTETCVHPPIFTVKERSSSRQVGFGS